MPTALIVAEYGSLNGGERSLLALLPGLIKRDWAFRALVPPDTPLQDALQALEIGTLPFCLFDEHGDRKTQAQIRDQIRQAIEQTRPDLVHSNSLATSRLAGPVCKSSSTPGIGYLRDILKLSRQAINDLNENDALVAVSRATRQFHASQGLVARRVHVVYNGVDSNLFAPGPNTGSLQRELGISDSSPCVLYVGQIGIRKGLDTWLDAAELVSRQRSDCHFVIVGTRQSGKQESIDYEANLVARSKRGKLAGKVHWLGQRGDVARLMRDSAILMHCANQEPLGRVLLEAMASALPAVATDVGGTGEIFSHPVLASLLCPPGQADQIATQALRLLEQRELHETVAAHQRDVALSRFSLDQNASALATIYESLTRTTQ